MSSRSQFRLPPVGSADPRDAGEFARAREALRPDKSLSHPQLREAASLLGGAELKRAEKVLEQFLQKHPRDADAYHLLAEAARRQGREAEAERLLAACLKLAPDLTSARFNYANALLLVKKADAALEQLDELLKKEPRNPLFRRVKAKALHAGGNFEAAAVWWGGLTSDYPGIPDCWVNYGHALRSAGRQAECIAAYRRALEISPQHGAAYWSLANLKTYRFDDILIRQMEGLLAGADLPVEDRVAIHFALGKALGDIKLFARSFANYARGNAMFRLGIDYDPEVTTKHVARCKALFTPAFFREQAGSGCPARDPIFIVGIPRSGSTLLEQILSSHSLIEGTAELPDIPALARRLEESAADGSVTDYLDIIAGLDSRALRTLGEQYLESTATRRKTDRPFFVDKMLNNALHIPLIHLILPEAKIIDVRRHPMACCFSNFTQHFATSQLYTYRLNEIGLCYRDYVEAMAHFDRVLPGRVHRVVYENLVADPETEIRRVFDYMDLSFEDACLRFYENDRAARTISSEQVRKPIFKDGLEQWRAYEPWLGPLKTTLGSLVDTYPGIPCFD